jgi:hypothetical protein
MQRFRWRPKRLLLGVALTLFCLAFAESVPADSKVYQDALHSTGPVEVLHPDGRTMYGTCWLVDDEHRLPGSPLHLAEEPIADWVLASMLVGSVVVFLVVGIMACWNRQPTNSTAHGVGGVGKGATKGPLQGSDLTRA